MADLKQTPEQPAEVEMQDMGGRTDDQKEGVTGEEQPGEGEKEGEESTSAPAEQSWQKPPYVGPIVVVAVTPTPKPHGPQLGDEDGMENLLSLFIQILLQLLQKSTDEIGERHGFGQETGGSLNISMGKDGGIELSGNVPPALTTAIGEELAKAGVECAVQAVNNNPQLANAANAQFNVTITGPDGQVLAQTQVASPAAREELQKEQKEGQAQAPQLKRGGGETAA